MYEIWLAMNIAFEIAWDLWPALLPLALVWATVMLINRKKLALVSASSLAALAVLVALAEQQYLLARPVALAADAVRQE